MDPTEAIRGALEAYRAVASRVLRHWATLLVGFAVVFAAIAGFVGTRRNMYRSETLVRIDPVALLDVGERAGAHGEIRAQLAQLVTSRSQLESLIVELDLYRETGVPSERSSLGRKRRASQPMAELVAAMRADVETELVGEDAFVIAFRHSDPRVARTVAARLAQTFIEERRSARTRRANRTVQVISARLDEMLAERTARDDALTTFKELHAAAIRTIEARHVSPAQPRINLIAPTFHGGDRTGQLRARRAEIQARLLALRERASAPRSAEVDELREQISQAQAALAALRSRFTPDYPDVRIAEHRLGVLSASLREAIARAGAPVPASAETAALVQQIADLDAEIARAERPAHPAPFPASPAPLPSPSMTLAEVEAALARLESDVRTVRESYLSLLTKKLDAEFALSVEEQSAAEAARIVDEAEIAERPVSPNRPKLLGAGLAAALLFGLALAFVRSVLDTRIFTERDLARVSLPVLVAIPDYHPARRHAG